MSKTKWPFGPADVLAADYAAIIPVVIANTRTQLTIAQLTGAATVNLTVASENAVGDELIVKSSADGTNRVITWGTGMTGNAYTNIASKNAIHNFIFDGATFVLKGSNQTN